MLRLNITKAQFIIMLFELHCVYQQTSRKSNAKHPTIVKVMQK